MQETISALDADEHGVRGHRRTAVGVCFSVVYRAQMSSRGERQRRSLSRRVRRIGGDDCALNERTNLTRCGAGLAVELGLADADSSSDADRAGYARRIN